MLPWYFWYLTITIAAQPRASQWRRFAFLCSCTQQLLHWLIILIQLWTSDKVKCICFLNYNLKCMYNLNVCTFNDNLNVLLGNLLLYVNTVSELGVVVPPCFHMRTDIKCSVLHTTVSKDKTHTLLYNISQVITSV